MSAIVSFNGNFVTTAIDSINDLFIKGRKFNESVIDSIASDELIGAIIRKARSFNYANFITSGLNFVGNSAAHQQSYHLENCRIQYNMRFSKDGKDISNKGWHLRCSSDGTYNLMVELTNQMLSQVNGELSRFATKVIPPHVKETLDTLGVKGIYGIDGSDVTLRECAKGLFPNKGTGRKKKDGSSAAPGLKIHALVDLIRCTILNIDVTEAVASERDYVHPELLENCLLIADRGYFSTKLEDELSDAGVFYIIKGRRNMTSGIILEAYGEDGKSLPEYIGKKFGDINENCKDKLLDVTIKTDEGKERRIVRKLNPNIHSTRKKDDQNNSDTEDRYIYLRTNLKREIVPANVLFDLYRLRWQNEIIFECLQQGNCFKCINSNDKNVILNFLMFGIMSYLLKLHLLIQTAITLNRHFLDISIEKLNIKFNVLKTFFEKLGQVKKSRYYELLKITLDLIAKYCFISHVSKRDKAAQKSYGLILKHIHAALA